MTSMGNLKNTSTKSYSAIDKDGPCLGPKPQQESILDAVRSSVIQMLSMGQVQMQMVSMAMMFDEDTNNSDTFSRDLVNAQTYIKTFVSDMVEKFPHIIVDYRMEDLRSIVVHKRTSRFNLRAGYLLYINGNILKAMEAASEEEYTRYIFTLKLLMLCEIAGRMVISDLGQSRRGTPPLICPPSYSRAFDGMQGNSSKMIEFGLLGGTIELGDDGSQRGIQARIPYLMDGNMFLRQIKKSEIREIAYGINYQFPLMVEHNCPPIHQPAFWRAGTLMQGIAYVARKAFH